MIERDSFDGDIYEVSCDYCSEDIEIDSGGDWQDMIRDIKEKGWKIKKMNDEDWQHMCPDCVKNKKAFK
jgi:hypothetical protein